MIKLFKKKRIPHCPICGNKALWSRGYYGYFSCTNDECESKLSVWYRNLLEKDYPSTLIKIFDKIPNDKVFKVKE